MWIFLLFAAIALAGIIFSAVSANRRKTELASFARALGLMYAAEADRDLPERFADFHPFGEGSGRRASNLLFGGRGEIDWQIFDYRYTTGSGKDSTTHSVGVVAARVPVFFAALQIRPEGLFDKIAGALGFPDINFESEAFSRRYHVQCADRKLAYDIIHPQMIEYLMTLPPANWQMSGPVILINKTGVYDPEQIERVMKMIEGFVLRLPAYVRQDR
ncbi:MAG TPA: hypothetical protein VIL86_20055 [Tepidisphaeraceae bacterium]|jgi:hypothetical protein